MNNTTHSGTVSYAWEFGDPTTTADKSSLKSPKWTYTAPGAYKVTLKATASGCTSELTKNANNLLLL
jgi:PKD repeat protein